MAGHTPRAQRVYEGVSCRGCGIDLNDGYVSGCKHCQERRLGRLTRGHLLTPTAYPGEAIDNTDAKGRLVPCPG